MEPTVPNQNPNTNPSPTPVPPSGQPMQPQTAPVAPQQLAGMPGAPVTGSMPTPTVIPPTSPASSGQSPQPVVSTPLPPTPSVVSPQPNTPPAPMMNGVAGVPPVAASSGETGRRKRWILSVAVIGLVVLLGGGYVFGFYLPGQPSNVYKSSLKNSGKAVDKLVEYTNSQSTREIKGVTADGNLTVKSPEVSFDATLSTSFDKDANGTAAVSANILGKKLDVNLRSVHAGQSETPDLYLQVSGAKAYLDSFGLSSLDSLDGQWIAVDHTILDTVLQGAGQSGSMSPTNDQLNDAARKVQEVNKKYIFTTDSATAVLKDQKYIAKETRNGQPTNHYKVGYDKAHLEAYVGALKTALDSSSLNSWSQQANKKSLSETLNIASLQTKVKTLNGNYQFDLYANTKTRLVQSIQFADPSDKDSSFTIAQNYTGGDSYPFSLTINGKDTTDNTTGSYTIGLTLNMKTNKSVLTVNGSGGQGKSTKIDAKFNIAPNDKAVQVSAPSGSIPIMDVLNQLGLGGTSPVASKQLTSDSAANDLLTFIQ